MISAVLAFLTYYTDSLYFDLLNLFKRGGSLFWPPWHRFPGLGRRTGDFASRIEEEICRGRELRY